MFNKKGFTLIELMIVISIIAILATISLFGLTKTQASARDTQRQQTIGALRAANEKYFGDNAIYPAPGANWAAYIAVLTVGNYLSAAPTDPCAGGTAIPATGVMATCTPAAYAYTQPGGTTTYRLTLTKEGGGTSVVNNPN